MKGSVSESLVSPLKSVKNEVHNIVQILQLTQYSSPKRFTRELPPSQEPSLIHRFRSLLTTLSAVDEFETTLSTLQPFTEVLRTNKAPAPIAAVVLAAIHKFINYNLIRVDRPAAPDCINHIANALIEWDLRANSPSDEVVLLKVVTVMIDTLRCPAGEYLDDQNAWGMLKRCYAISRQASNSLLLRSTAEGALQQLVLRIFSGRRIEQTQLPLPPPPPAPPSNPPQNARRQRITGPPYGEPTMVRCLRFLAFLVSYGSRRDPVNQIPTYVHAPSRILRRGPSSSPSAQVSPPAIESSPDLLESGSDMAEAEILALCSPSDGNDSETFRHEMRSIGLTLLNMALETAGDEISKSARLILGIQEHVCKALLLNADTPSLYLLSMTLRCIFNLFMYMKKHLKVQLEMFFNSFHLQVASESKIMETSGGFKRGKNDAEKGFKFIAERRELALSSLLEFCREPDLMLELYENYDCDLRCTNLFENLVKTLATAATPDVMPFSNVSKDQPAARSFRDLLNVYDRGTVYETVLLQHRPTSSFRKTIARVTALHRLALAGLCSVTQSLAFRCVWDTRGPFLRPDAGDDEQQSLSDCPVDEVRLEELKAQREAKKRLAAGAQIFNRDPEKCLPALENLGLLPTPPTSDAMAEFLRTTAGIDLRVIGEYLAKPGAWAADVRRDFTSQLNFRGLPVVEALRLYLTCFRLPGESQQIERILDSFAVVFFTQQPTVRGAEILPPPTDPKAEVLPIPQRTARWVPPEGYNAQTRPDETSSVPSARTSQTGPLSTEAAPLEEWPNHAESDPPVAGATVFRSSDTVFVLSYSIILLNTDLHNQQVKRKMSIEDFIRNNGGLNANQDLPAAYLTSIYKSIKQRQIAIFASSESSFLVSLMVENRAFWDYLLSHSDFFGTYSSTLTDAKIRTPMQAFHQKAMFMSIIEDADILKCLGTVFASTRDPVTAVDCVVAFGDLIRIGAFYGTWGVLTDIAALLLDFVQPICSSKTQLAVPVMVHLVSLASAHFDLRGWTIYLEFMSRLALIGLLPTVFCDFETFDVSSDQRAAVAMVYGKGRALKSPCHPEHLNKLQAMPTSRWFNELAAILFSDSNAENVAEVAVSEDSDAASNFALQVVGPEKRPESIHQKALETAMNFWKTCVFFPHQLASEKAPQMQGTFWAPPSVLDALQTIFVERCPMDDIVLGRLKNVSAQSLKDLVAALIIRIRRKVPRPPTPKPPSKTGSKESDPIKQMTRSRSGSMEPATSPLEPVMEEEPSLTAQDEPVSVEVAKLIEEVTSKAPVLEATWIKYTFQRDEAPLLRVDATAARQFCSDFDTGVGLTTLTQVVLVLDNNRGQDPDLELLFRYVWKEVMRLVISLLDRISTPTDPAEGYLIPRPLDSILSPPATSSCDSEDGEMDSVELAPEIPSETTQRSPPEISRCAISTAVNELLAVEDEVLFDGYMVERLVVTTLRLCISMGHHTDIAILGPLARAFDDICRLKNGYVYQFFPQISSGVQLLLNAAVYGGGLHRMDADAIYASASGLLMPPFFLSLFDFLYRVAPCHIWATASPPKPEMITLQTIISNTAMELICGLALSSDFHATVRRVLRRGRETSSFCVPYFTRLLTQVFILHMLPYSLSHTPSAMFDLEEAHNLTEAPGMRTKMIELLPKLYVGVSSPEPPPPAAAGGEAHTPSTNDADSTTADDHEDYWELWGPIAQALALTTAFGTRLQRRPAMMHLQHHLSLMPVSEDRTVAVRRWMQTIELILFPLMSLNFIYPFPSVVLTTPPKKRLVFGQGLLECFPEYKLILCRIPGQEVARGLIDLAQCPFGALPGQNVVQRKAQSVGFVCRALLGKLDMLFEESSWQSAEEGGPPLVLFPTVLRVLRIFLHEMHGAAPALFDAIVEATKNFLLVLGTATQLQSITDEQTKAIISSLLRQDPATFVPVAGRTADNEESSPLQTADEVLEAYDAAAEPYRVALNDVQRRLYAVVFYMLRLAGRVPVLLSVFEVLVPNKRSSPPPSSGV